MSKQEKVKIAVDDAIYQLVKEGKINMVFAAPGSVIDQAITAKSSKAELITIENLENPKQNVDRRIIGVDHVSQGYIGKGYPPAYRVKREQTRIKFDMIIKESNDEPKQEPAAAE